MKLYLTARSSRREELLHYRDQLVGLGHEVVSTWHDDPLIPDDDDEEDDGGNGDEGAGGEALHMPTPNAADATIANETGNTARVEDGPMAFHAKQGAPNMQSRREILEINLATRIFTEVVECDAMVAFTDGENHSREAAYGEYGGALWRGKKMWIVGQRYHTLHYYRDVKTFENFAGFLQMLQTSWPVRESCQSKGS